MSNLSHRQIKIQEKRKQTPWREFVMEICSWINVAFYKRKSIISTYPEFNRSDNAFNVSPLQTIFDFNSGVDCNSQKYFFDQFNDLYSKSLFPSLIHVGNIENSSYAEGIINSKNCYLSHSVVADCENIMYSFNIKDNCNVIINSINVYSNSSNIYSSSGISDSNNVFYSAYIHNCNNNWFCTNMIGCNECIHCSGLENQSYCIDNKTYSQDEYYKLKRKVVDDSLNIPHIPLSHTKFIVNSHNCTGNYVINCNNAVNIYDSTNFSHGNNILLVSSKEDSSYGSDVFMAGRFNHFYGVTRSGTFSDHCYCSHSIWQSHNIYYSYYLESCSFCLGCIGLKNKSYCILNKQYSKEEWYQKVDEIFGQMEADGILGQFFPASMNPFYFNDTAAYLIDPSFTKEEVTAKGYLWRDEAIKVDIPEDAQVVASSELVSFESYDDQGNRHINADILKCVIQDDQGNYYRIIPMEYKFLMKHGLPLPRKHWLERMKENFRIH